MKKKSCIVSLSLLFLCSFNASAKTTSAILSGNWGNASRWNNGVPACGDVVNISAGVTITVNNVYDLASGGCAGVATTINVSGTMRFNNNPSYLNLACGSKVNILVGGQVTNAGSGGNDCQIYICGVQVYRTTTPCTTPCSTGTLTGPAVITNTGLPVKLLHFSGTQNENKIQLTWSTASEINFNYFIVEKSVNGKEFRSVDHVNGHGTTNVRQDYQKMDDAPIIGTNYYRLTSVDIDNYREVFSTIAVLFSGGKTLSMFPNPFNGSELNFQVNFDLSGGGTLVIFDGMGKEVARHFILDNNTMLHFASPLPSGLYIAKLTTDNFSNVTRLVVR